MARYKRRMRHWLHRAEGRVLAGILAGMMGLPVWAQTHPLTATTRTESASLAQSERRAASGLLTADEGLGVLGAALESRYKVEPHSDCSHLVHAIYEKAGLPYPYASSSDLFAGSGSFRRVAQPQAGDVVVWPGHAGIVVNPAQRTFFSALRSGLGVQAYDSVYWKGRGHPRFLRYVKTAPGTVLVAAKRTPSTPTFETAGLRSGPSRAPAATEAEEVGDADGEDETVARRDVPVTIPAVPSVVTVAGAQPKAEQLQPAVVGALHESATSVQAQDVFKLRGDLLAFGQLEVRKVHLKRDASWVEVRFRDLVPVTAQGRKHPDVQRWSMRRGADGWEVVLPADAVYLPRQDAVRILAHQLAGLTEGNSQAREVEDHKAQLARLLGVLLQGPRTH